MTSIQSLSQKARENVLNTRLIRKMCAYECSVKKKEEVTILLLIALLDFQTARKLRGNIVSPTLVMQIHRRCCFSQLWGNFFAKHLIILHWSELNDNQ